MPLNRVFFEASKLVSTKTPITKALLPPSRLKSPRGLLKQPFPLSSVPFSDSVDLEICLELARLLQCATALGNMVL